MESPTTKLLRQRLEGARDEIALLHGWRAGVAAPAAGGARDPELTAHLLTTVRDLLYDQVVARHVGKRNRFLARLDTNAICETVNAFRDELWKIAGALHDLELHDDPREYTTPMDRALARLLREVLIRTMAKVR